MACVLYNVKHYINIPAENINLFLLIEKQYIMTLTGETKVK